MASSAQNQASDVARAYFEAQNRHNTEWLMQLFGSSGTFQDPTMSAPISGEKLQQAFAAGFVSFPDMTFEVLDLFDDGADRVAVQWRWRATNTGPLGDAPPTGQAIDIAGMDLLVISEGTIQSARAYFDLAAMTNQLSGKA
ncbi:hypothetical protein KDA_55480 [Dictyobacter alpinus]|uniref:SnoaL-like domain-containing protein n=1 Tax=Dictyobacter alpinus TaxID=2014873 RepID=A0A402BF91_9CHLR|nr:ester cyclase [Dictyobacter alpinus]GCE30064.1 hypothetical protein KDA_55480 [Dictyobacter alpinus]